MAGKASIILEAKEAELSSFRVVSKVLIDSFNYKLLTTNE